MEKQAREISSQAQIQELVQEDVEKYVKRWCSLIQRGRVSMNKGGIGKISPLPGTPGYSD